MQTYSIFELQANLSAVFHQADIDGSVLVEFEGRQYQIRSLNTNIKHSPLDVPRVKLAHPVTIDEILDDIQAGREQR